MVEKEETKKNEENKISKEREKRKEKQQQRNKAKVECVSAGAFSVVCSA